MVTIDRPWTAEERPRADAIVTRTPGIGIGVTTADCGPVLFADAQAQVIGAAHAGWRGAFMGVLEATVAAMERCGADRARIAAVLGPDHPASRTTRWDRNSPNGLPMPTRKTPAFSSRPGARATPCSICRATSWRGSRAAGVGRIEDLGCCTYADPARFFSYRRSTHAKEPDYGRHVNAIALAG